MSNSAAQACHEKLGYETIGDYGLFMFTEPHEPFGAA